MTKPNSVAFNVANKSIRQTRIHSNRALGKDGQSGQKDLCIPLTPALYEKDHSL